MKRFFTGDTVPLRISLERDGAPYAINPTDVVTVALRSSKSVMLAGPWTAAQGTPGADWPAGVIVLNSIGSDTQALASQYVQIEVQVATATGDKATWLGPVMALVKDVLP